MNEVLKDEAVVKELLQQETAEDVQKFLASKGVEISIEEINQIQAQFLKAAENDEEISDEELEQVAGGFSMTVFFEVAKNMVTGRWRRW
ncbi:MAG: Nif11-like leader peptide family RiPP precursor [Selenomonadaceae bacterium]|nr:Nif11-like leader peptide family RiPP precursor [Selenomonadaceae bacterium]